MTKAIKDLREEAKELSIRFNAYQQTSQSVVNLAFGLRRGLGIGDWGLGIEKRL